MIWICGATGLIGRSLVASAVVRGLPIVTSASDVDVRDLLALERFSRTHRPRIVLNVSGFTDVELAQSRAERAFEINAYGTRNLAIAAEKVGARFVHVSTDFVFDGRSEKAYDEQALPNPINVYGKSKLEGEREAMNSNSNAVVLRTSWVYGDSTRSFLGKIIVQILNGCEFSVVDDQYGTPNDAAWVAETALEVALRPDLVGIYHLSARGVCSRFEWANQIAFELVSGGWIESSPRIASTQSGTTVLGAPRPARSALDSKKLETALQSTFPNWKDRLSRYLASLDKGG